jgi:hypothetical protein
MAGNEQGRPLLSQMRELSAADLSVLQAVVESLGVEDTLQVTTTPGSANDRLWSEMTKLARLIRGGGDFGLADVA